MKFVDELVWEDYQGLQEHHRIVLVDDIFGRIIWEEYLINVGLNEMDVSDED